MKINKSNVSNNGMTLIVIYEIKQIDQILKYLDDKNISIEACQIVAIEYGVEQELLTRNITHTSLTKYISLDTDFEQQLHYTESIARRFHEHPAMDFFVCNDIRLGGILEILFQFYLDQFIYSFYICEKILEPFSDISNILIPYSTTETSYTSGPLASQNLNVVVAAFKHYANTKGVNIINIGTKETINLKPKLFKRLKKNTLSILLYIHNFAVEILVPQKPIKILVNDYWSHIEPFITKMDDVELIMMYRSEAPKIGIKQIWKHRIRFYHPGDFKTKANTQKVEEIMSTFSTGWNNSRKNKDFQKLFTYNGMSYWSVVEPILKLLITGDYARCMVSDSISIEQLFNRNNINRILLLASVSRQYHYPITAMMAERQNIPSIELQHAIPTTESTSAYSFFTSRYLAAYGNIIRDIYVKNHGYDPQRIISVGSPRFDKYIENALKKSNREITLKKLSLDPLRPVIMVNVQQVVELGRSYYGGNSRLYDVIKLFKDLALLQKDVQGLQIILKFRPGHFRLQYKKSLQEIFANNIKDIATDDTTNLSEIMRASDIITSGYSTLVIEALINKTPVILYPLRKWAYEFRKLFKKTAFYVHSQGELTLLIKKLLYNPNYRKDTLKNIETFLKEEYSFDGRSSERIISLLRNPPELKSSQNVLKDKAK